MDDKTDMEALTMLWFAEKYPCMYRKVIVKHSFINFLLGNGEGKLQTICRYPCPQTNDFDYIVKKTECYCCKFRKEKF